jgi:hypothetical protein
MDSSLEAFADFERSGWEDPRIVADGVGSPPSDSNKRMRNRCPMRLALSIASFAHSGSATYPSRIALLEAYRVLRLGGQIVFSVWDVPELAVGIGAVYDAIRAHGSMDVGLPTGPSFFAFRDPEQSIEVLRSQSATAIVAIRAALREKVSEYKRGVHFEVPMPAIVAAAIKQ